ncbi:ADP-ribosylglycohydrolase family protein [Aldersonia sp. NBC_00410]|uniref:ADP-ribosylglycohydrolase family protein n=1 Tax=Aldersonia sp. NBC_00410 TaxID=2975954 RepID=UPI0022590CE4|nr:ADP-ribosylglycohydrolase family protein [Aldersonia sp. NBC_00410]MCX5046711.1 ADP-ribosylglycohydrolase family protein [Aldersonia sp. NBC_00410]
MTTLLARYTNALTGLAAGDAWGYQVEFTTYDRMKERPVPPPPALWRISDDTQMTIALHRALSECADFSDVDETTAIITKHFLNWAIDPDNNRAPGRTCMTSLRHLREGAHWSDPDGALESAGCGAVMRLTPAAFTSDRHWLGLTALQALITHKHPRAVASSLLVADALRNADRRPGRFLDHALDAVVDIYEATSCWLTDPYLAEILSPITTDPTGYLIDGLDDGILDALLRADDARTELRILSTAEYGDPCEGIGEGWECATATALAFMVADMTTSPTGERAPLSPRGGLAWAATSNGDSDSIAAIAGALVGAASVDPHFWRKASVAPRFESRYEAELAACSGNAVVSLFG